jgi:hypothetical protein
MDEDEMFPATPGGPRLEPVAGFVERDTDPIAVVKFTQQMRYMAADHITCGGTQIPDKIGDLLMVLNGMDQAALTTRKLDIEEQAAESGHEAIEAVRTIRSMFGNRDPFIAAAQEQDVIGQRINSIIPEGFVPPEVQFKPGEKDQGEAKLDVSDFVSPDE